MCARAFRVCAKERGTRVVGQLLSLVDHRLLVHGQDHSVSCATKFFLQHIPSGSQPNCESTTLIVKSQPKSQAKAKRELEEEVARGLQEQKEAEEATEAAPKRTKKTVKRKKKKKSKSSARTEL